MYEYYNYNKESNDINKEALEAQVKARAKAEAKQAKRNKRKKWAMCIVYGLVFGIVAGVAFQGVNIGGSILKKQLGFEKSEVKEEVKTTEEPEKKAPEKKAEEKTTETQSERSTLAKSPVATQLTTSSSLDVSTVAANVMPAIVSITNKSVQEVRSMFGRGIQEYESTSCGSGIIIGENDDELLIVTNNHVVEDANTLSVGFADEEVCEAVIKGTDPNNDLAVIAVNLDDIKASTMDSIAIATMGDSDALVIGEQVVAIGNALGYGQSVTTGIVSALDREVGIDDLARKLIQTDAAINPGNSGGALLNMRGEVVGINSAKLASSQVEGMGYAIPMATATPIVEELMNRQTRNLVSEKDASYIGISGVSVTDDVSSTYDIPKGVYVSEVTENGPADKAGIVKGDVIEKFDGVTVASINDIKEQLKYYKAGEQVDILISRTVGSEYVEKTVTVTLGKRSESGLADLNEGSDTDEADEDEYYYYDDGSDIFMDPFSIFGY